MTQKETPGKCQVDKMGDISVSLQLWYNFLPGISTVMRQSDGLSRDGCEPISEECLKQSRYMSPQDRSNQEMNCDDCRPGSVSKATHHVSAPSRLNWCVAERVTRLPASPTRGAVSRPGDKHPPPWVGGHFPRVISISTQWFWEPERKELVATKKN